MNADIDYGLSPYKDNTDGRNGFKMNLDFTSSGGRANPNPNANSNDPISTAAAVANKITIGGKGATGTNHHNVRGDISVQPNTGNSNQRAGSIAFGSLRETATFLRWSTIGCTVVTVVWEGFAFPMRFVSKIWIKPAQVVLGGYLGFFCLLILGVELNFPKNLETNFGFLYDPLYRGFILWMMSGMAIAILDSIWETLVGLALGLIGTLYVYTYIKYPEYRRWKNYNERRPTALQEAKMYWSSGSIRSDAGDYGDAADNTVMGSSIQNNNNNEYTSLLSKVAWANPNKSTISKEARSLLV